MTTYLDKQLVVVMHRFELQGGQERSTYEIVTHLARMGWQIDVYSFTRTAWPSQLPIRWHRVPGFKIPMVFLRAFWFRWFTWVCVRSKYKTKSPRPLFFTLGIDSFFADVRCVQFLHSAAAALIRDGKLPHPNVRSILHKFYQQLMLNYHVWLEQKYLGRCSALIAISRSVEKDIRRLVNGAAHVPLSVIHHAPDAVKPSEISDGKKGNTTALLFVGTLERKGIEKALCYLGALKHLPWHFSVLGDGNRKRWEALAEKLGIKGKVSFLGHQGATSFYPLADLLLLPSLYEPFGLVISEAISLGCLPLASSECGAMELWDERPPWMKISAFDEDDRWIEALGKLLESAELRKKLSREAAEAFHRWSWEAAALQYEGAFLRVMGSRD